MLTNAIDAPNDLRQRALLLAAAVVEMGKGISSEEGPTLSGLSPASSSV